MSAQQGIGKFVKPLLKRLGISVDGSSASALRLLGQLSWPTGLGPFAHIQGPSDQSLIVNSNSNVILQSSGSHRLAVSGSGITAYTSLVPATDGNRDLGASSTRWGSVYAAGFVQVGAYTVATLPAATTAGRIIYVSDGAAGSPCLAFSDGTNWLRVDTLAAVSSS